MHICSILSNISLADFPVCFDLLTLSDLHVCASVSLRLIRPLVVWMKIWMKRCREWKCGQGRDEDVGPVHVWAPCSQLPNPGWRGANPSQPTPSNVQRTIHPAVNHTRGSIKISGEIAFRHSPNNYKVEPLMNMDEGERRGSKKNLLVSSFSLNGFKTNFSK